MGTRYLIRPRGRTQGTSLSDALFSRTQQRVLGILYSDPQRSFFATEIFQRAGSGRGSVQRELQRLIESGLATTTRIGNQKHYRANHESPIFAELRSIILKTSGLADPIRQALDSLARKIDLALIYGSVARGEARADSDVDLLVVGSGITMEQLYTRLACAEEIVGRRISPTLLTPREYRKRREDRNVFLTKVLARETIVLIGSVDVESATR